MTQVDHLWVKDHDKTRIVGFKSTFVDYPLRTIKCKPNGAVNPNHHVFRWLNEELGIMGYSIEIDEKGNIKVNLPYGDRYAVVLRRIAWAYYIALSSEPKNPHQMKLKAPEEARQ